MSRHDPSVFFDEKHAAEYDQRFARLAPFRDSLHLLMVAVLSHLPERARVLCVGAGTGAELLHLAQRFPTWHFTAVEPSAPMLEVCRRKAEEHELAGRCTFHHGFLESLPDTGPFDAATALLVSQFILVEPDRVAFFKQIASRLVAGGCLVSSDLATAAEPNEQENRMKLWLTLMIETGQSPEKIHSMRVAYQQHVAILPSQKVSDLIEAGGFERPNQLLQTGLIHGWFSARKQSLHG